MFAKCRNSGAVDDQVASDIEQAVHLVDHALRDALCNAKNRAMGKRVMGMHCRCILVL